MKKAYEPIPTLDERALDYTPKFHYGDDVTVRTNATTPYGKFYSGMSWQIRSIDTRGVGEYNYRVVFHTCEHCGEIDARIKESDLEIDYTEEINRIIDDILDEVFEELEEELEEEEDEEDEEEEVECKKPCKKRTRKAS